MSHHRQKSRAFTLMELILVMLIAATALAIAAPHVGGWSRGARLRNCAEEFVRMTRLARSRAVTDAAVYRIQLDTATVNFKLLVQQGTEFVDVQKSLGRNAAPLKNATIELVRMGTELTDSAADSIDFYPTGRTQPMRIIITDDAGHKIGIECATPAEDFRVVTSQTAS
jgi:prepilin-type N-terminal cleavage/methylation domain-containing protein